MDNKQAPKQKGTDKKRVHRHSKGQPRITQSKEKRNRGPHDRQHEYQEWLKKHDPSKARPEDIAQYMPPAPTATELMLELKYAGEEPIQRYVQVR